MDGGPRGAARFVRPDVFERERTKGPPRLRIGCHADAVEVMLDLARGRSPAWWVLHVLAPSRRAEAVAGRYPLEIPVPHVHHDRARFDADEAAIFQRWRWVRSPLRPGDDPGRV